MSEPLVTALIDTYNHERFIEEAIVSVLEQDFPAEDVEILVVDDGSTDGTPELLRKFGTRVRVLRKTNGGQASAFNAGIPEARGEIVAFLDADDWWARNKLSRTIDYLTSHPEVGILGHGFEQVDSFTGQTTSTLPPESRAFSFSTLSDTTFFRHMMCFFGTSRVVIRKKIAEQALPIPESLVIEADEYLSIMSIARSRAVLLQDSLTYYRLHENNLYQLRSPDASKVRRLQGVFCALARELPPALAQAGISREAIEILVHPLEVGAKKIKLQIEGGSPWETFQVERADRRYSYSGGSPAYRLFELFSLGLTLLMPPRKFYKLQNWYGTSGLRKLRGSLGEPVRKFEIEVATQPTEAAQKRQLLPR
jgi:glycosyltransferase involved in cell wall biosynthesis